MLHTNSFDDGRQIVIRWTTISKTEKGNKRLPLQKNIRVNTFRFSDFTYRNRLQTLVINIGDLALGGINPIRLQSMTSVNTLDTKAVLAQCVRLIEAGSELVRLTAQGIREAEHLAVIKTELHRLGYRVPLVADIHFNPEAALTAARLVEKVRINPGNYTDRRSGKTDYSDADYSGAIERMALKLSPLLAVCKQYGTALRIGSNHGSLSERITSRFGDTPAGMVEAALEFVDICENAGFRNLVLSMKASNTRVMVEATRLLVARMITRGTVYPLHLGVTEAGNGEDGRVRSAAGIGALLADGIGDTIRVSLTEDPEKELPVARAIVKVFHSTTPAVETTPFHQRQATVNKRPDPPQFSKYVSGEWEGLGGGHPALVVGTKNADILFEPGQPPLLVSASGKKLPLLNPDEAITGDSFALLMQADDLLVEKEKNQPALIVLRLNHPDQLPAIRQTIAKLRLTPGAPPLIICHESKKPDASLFAIETAALLGSVLIDGLADGIWLINTLLPTETVTHLAFNLLQATRLRFSRTEYISCPSCGRTLFDIQQTVQRVKASTSHLQGLTIGVMGCIVNGPGEMAGADYGVVGAGAGKVTLFKGQQIMTQGVPEEEAAAALVSLIKENGDWRSHPSNE